MRAADDAMLPFSKGEKQMRTGAISRLAGIAVMLAALLVLTACWVESINGLAEAGRSEKDPDVVVDQRLTGSWNMSAADDDKCSKTLVTIAFKDEIYEVKWSALQGCNDKDQSSQARLVRLDTYYFFDVFAAQHDVCDTCLAKHQIFQLKFDGDGFSLTPIDSDWLKASVAAKTIKLATMPDNPELITAPTAELKAFCRRFAADKTAFRSDAKSMFKRAAMQQPASGGLQ
jgi:hypothetical protein